MSQSDRTFPPLPEYTATWAPIYLEPIIGSGEQITVGIAARDFEGNVQVVPTLREDALVCFIGDKSVSLLNIIDASITSLQGYLKNKGEFQAWTPPLSGFKLGQHKTIHADSMTDAIRLAMQMSSAFATLDDLLSVTEEDEEQEIIVGQDRWPMQVKEAVYKKNPEYVKYFDQKFTVRDGARATHVDYVGKHVAANLGKLVPGRGLSQLVKNSKVKLWDLSVLRDFEEESIFGGTRPAYELILYRPNENDPTYTDKQIISLHEALLELTSEGDEKELRVFDVHSPEDAAARILKHEAA